MKPSDYTVIRKKDLEQLFKMLDERISMEGFKPYQDIMKQDKHIVQKLLRRQYPISGFIRYGFSSMNRYNKHTTAFQEKLAELLDKNIQYGFLFGKGMGRVK